MHHTALSALTKCAWLVLLLSLAPTASSLPSITSERPPFTAKLGHGAVDSLSAPRRSLADASPPAPAVVTTVSSASALAEAVLSQVPHVEITSHLNLSGLPLLLGDGELAPSSHSGSILGVLSGVSTIRGNCDSPPPAELTSGLSRAAPLQPLLPGQCLLVVDATFVDVCDDFVWLDGLYVRFEKSPDRDRAHLIRVGFEFMVNQGATDTAPGTLYMTNMVVQGDGASEVGGLLVNYEMYAEGCTFSHLGGGIPYPPIWLIGQDDTSQPTTASFADTTFRQSPPFERTMPEAASVIVARGAEPVELRLAGCTFEGDAALHAVYDVEQAFGEGRGGDVYSDDAALDAYSLERGAQPVLPLADAANVSFVSADDEWFVQAQEDAEEGTRSSWGDADAANATPEEAGIGSDESDSATAGLSNGELAGILVAAVAAAFIVTVVVILLCCRRRKAEPGADGQPAGKVDPRQAAAAYASGYGSGTPTSNVSVGPFGSGRAAGASGTSFNFGPPTYDLRRTSWSDSQADPDGSACGDDGSAFVDPTGVAGAAGGVGGPVKPPPPRSARNNPAGVAEAELLTLAAGIGPFHESSANVGSAATVSTGCDSRTLNGSCAWTYNPLDSTQTTAWVGQPLTATDAARGDDVGAEEAPRPLKVQPLQGHNPAFGVDTFTLTEFSPSPRAAPARGAGHQALLEFIEYQLDCYGPKQEFLPNIVLMGAGPRSRFQGGQAIVQIARNRLTGMELAIKMFASRSAFAAEAALYRDTNSPLRRFMPELFGIHENEDGSSRDPHGHPLPPCIVMEKGESLDIYCDRAKPDRSQAYSIVLHIAKRLGDLHAAGFAHGDLKPSNTMWLGRENRWTLIDFGCATRLGAPAPASFSLAYAAPEIVHAFRQGKGGLASRAASAAADAWALGVVILELLSGRSVFTMAGGRNAVIAQIAGDSGTRLPWEGGPHRRLILSKLGGLKRHALALLDRDPSKRPSMDDFVDACDRLLAGTTSFSDEGTVGAGTDGLEASLGSPLADAPAPEAPDSSQFVFVPTPPEVARKVQEGPSAGLSTAEVVLEEGQGKGDEVRVQIPGVKVIV